AGFFLFEAGQPLASGLPPRFIIRESDEVGQFTQYPSGNAGESDTAPYYGRPAFADRYHRDGLMDLITARILAFCPSFDDIGDVFAVMHRGLRHAAIRCVGIIPNHKYVVVSLKVEVGSDFAAWGEHESVVLEERMVGDAGGPHDGVALDRFAADDQLVSCHSFDGAVRIEFDTFTAQPPRDT